jgi:hypothetical protein
VNQMEVSHASCNAIIVARICEGCRKSFAGRGDMDEAYLYSYDLVGLALSGTDWYRPSNGSRKAK